MSAPQSQAMARSPTVYHCNEPVERPCKHKRFRSSSIDSNPVMIVQVGLKQQPAASNEFEQLLANNRITLEFDKEKSRDELDRKQDALGVRVGGSG